MKGMRRRLIVYVIRPSDMSFLLCLPIKAVILSANNSDFLLICTIFPLPKLWILWFFLLRCTTMFVTPSAYLNQLHRPLNHFLLSLLTSSLHISPSLSPFPLLHSSSWGKCQVIFVSFLCFHFLLMHLLKLLLFMSCMET